MSYQIEILQPQDIHSFRDLIKVFQEVFDMEYRDTPSESYLKTLLQKDDFLVLVATSGDKIVGGLTVYILNSYYTTRRTAYIYDVGVSVEHQRKGIGRLLLSALIKHCNERNFECAYVEAESTDHEALAFYRSTSANNELAAVHFTYYM